MKKKLISLVVAASIFVAPYSLGSGIPVVDVAGLAQAIEQVMALKSQIDNQIEQIKQAQAQYQAISGNRNLGQIFNDPALREYLPNEWTGIYDSIRTGNYNGAAKQIAEQIKNTEKLTGKTTEEQRIYDTLIANKAISTEAFQKTKARLDNIQQLMVQANQTGDAKAAADLANRLAAENAMIQTEQIRINLVQQLQQAELKLAEQQAQAKFRKARRGE